MTRIFTLLSAEVCQHILQPVSAFAAHQRDRANQKFRKHLWKSAKSYAILGCFLILLTGLIMAKKVKSKANTKAKETKKTSKKALKKTSRVSAKKIKKSQRKVAKKKKNPKKTTAKNRNLTFHVNINIPDTGTSTATAPKRRVRRRSNREILAGLLGGDWPYTTPLSDVGYGGPSNSALAADLNGEGVPVSPSIILVCENVGCVRAEMDRVRP